MKNAAFTFKRRAAKLARMRLSTSFDERVASDAERVLYRAKNTPHEKLIIDNAKNGRMMMNGIVQLSSVDEFIGHEMLSHVPLLAYGRVERVLIVGGGDCALSEVQLARC